MQHTGTYSETLPTGGSLKVTRQGWAIEYYIPGPDARYNGDWVHIPSNKVESHINALSENWDEYLKLKKMFPSGSEFTKEGLEGMSIRVGGYSEGVFLKGHYLKMETRKDIDHMAETFRYAQKRAEEIQNLFFANQNGKASNNNIYKTGKRKRGCGMSLLWITAIIIILYFVGVASNQ